MTIVQDRNTVDDLTVGEKIALFQADSHFGSVGRGGDRAR